MNYIKEYVNHFNSFISKTRAAEAKKADAAKRFASRIINSSQMEVLIDEASSEMTHANAEKISMEKIAEEFRKAYREFTLDSSSVVQADLNLLNPLFMRNADDVQTMANKYAKNPTMLRAVLNYADDNGFQIDAHRPEEVLDAFEAVEKMANQVFTSGNNNGYNATFLCTEYAVAPLIEAGETMNR